MRYSRQIQLEEVGADGQERLSRSKVLIVGMGGLGSPVGAYLSAAGIGRLGLVDGDQIDLSNLQRQVLFHSEDIGRSKVEVAASRLRKMNPDIQIDEFKFDLTADNLESLFSKYDLVIDCSDNFSTKFLINDGALKTGTPWIMGAVDRFEAQLGLFSGKGGQSCYRCLVPQAPRSEIGNCSVSGVIGAWVGVVGSLQASIATQFLVSPHFGGREFGKLISLDGRFGLRSLRHEISMRSSGCTCGMDPREITLSSGSVVCNGSIAENWEISLQDFKDELINGGIGVLDVRSEAEWEELSVRGSRCFPLDSLQNGELPNYLSAHRKWVVYCRTGARSKTAVKLLRSLSEGDYVSLLGGVAAIPPQDSIICKVEKI